ncbi:CBS domain-containing protein [Methylonatrum kenyense]|uniref:CBS domain-containing protein n=1 Tax=Methylonatrum kenyense TaxID=455253 RepID=UPI0020C01743|nr:CBS domain-containing protein [Methylonatrum kenyense]MCK8516328.1 CBS domain-containing protein [Methylonatrum kenyense]
MLVKDVMEKNVVTISPLATLREAMQRMRDNGMKSLVVDKQGPHDAYGLITYTTVLRTIVAEDGDIDLINVYDVAAKPVITVPSEMDVRHVARLMVDQDFRRLIVLDGNELQGIISMDDIVTPILEMVE